MAIFLFQFYFLLVDLQYKKSQQTYMSMQTYDRMKLEQLIDYFKSHYNKYSSAKTVSPNDLRNIYLSLQNIKGISSKQQTKAGQVKKQQSKNQQIQLDYDHILKLMSEGRSITKQFAKYNMSGLMKFYTQYVGKMHKINDIMNKKYNQFWQLAGACVDTTLSKFKQGNSAATKIKQLQEQLQRQKIKQRDLLAKLKQYQKQLNKYKNKQPSKIVNQMSAQQTSAIKGIQQYLIEGGPTEKYKDYVKSIAKSNNLPNTIMEAVENEYVTWYKLFNHLYLIFYETKIKYSEIYGKTLADKCYWLTTEISNKIKEKSKQLCESLRSQNKYSQNLSSLFELLKQQKINMLFNIQKKQAQQSKQSPILQKKQKITQPKFGQSAILFGLNSDTKKASPSVGISSKKPQQVKKKQKIQQTQYQKQIYELQAQIQKYKVLIKNKQSDLQALGKTNSQLQQNYNKLCDKNAQNIQSKQKRIKQLQLQNEKIKKYKEQNIKTLQKQRTIDHSRNHQTQQFLQKCKTLVKSKYTPTLVMVYTRLQEYQKQIAKINQKNNNKIQYLYDRIYEKYKKQNTGLQTIIDEDSTLQEKQAFIQQLLKGTQTSLKPSQKHTKTIDINRKSSNNSNEDNFQDLTMSYRIQNKTQKSGFRKQSEQYRSYKNVRSFVSGGINNSQYSQGNQIQQQNKTTQRMQKQLQKQIKERNQQIHTLKNDLYKKTNEIQQLKQLYKNQQMMKIFQNPQTQQFITTTIHRYVKNNSIISFNLLHRSVDHTDMIADIQKHANILFVGVTKTGHTIAAYSSLSVCNTLYTKQSKAIILSTKSQSSYQLKHKQKSIQKGKQGKFVVFSIGDITLRVPTTKQSKQQILVYFETQNKQIMNKQKDESHKQIRNSTTQTKIQLQSYQIYEIKFNQNNIIQDKSLQNIGVKSNILQLNRSRESMIDASKSTSKKNSQAQKILQLSQKVNRYEADILTLKRQNERLKGVGGEISQSYGVKNNNNERSKSIAKQLNQLSKQKSQETDEYNKLNIMKNKQKQQQNTQKQQKKNQQLINTLTLKCNNFQQQVKKYKMKSNQTSARIERLQNDNKNLQSQLNLLKKSKEQPINENNRNSKQIQDKLKQKENQINQLKIQQKQYQEKLKKLNQKQQQVNKLKLQQQRYKNKIEQLQKHKKSLQQRHTQKEKQIQDLKQKQVDNAQIKKLQQKILLDKQLQTNSQQFVQSQAKDTKKQQYQIKNKQFQDKKNQLQNVVQKLNKSISTKQKQMQELKQHHQKQIQKINKQNQKKLQQLKSQQQNKQQQQQSCNTLSQMQQNLKKQIGLLQKKNISLRQQIKNKQQKVTELIKDQKIKQTKIKLLQKNIRQLNQSILALKKQKQSQKLGQKQMSLPIKPTVDSIKSAPKQKQATRTGTSQLQKQMQMLQRVRKQFTQCQKQITTKHRSIRQLGQKQKKLLTSIQDLQQKSKKMGEQFQKAQKIVQNMEQIQKKKAQLQQNIKQLQKKINTLEIQRQQKQKKLRQYQSKIASIRIQLQQQISQKAKLQTIKKTYQQKVKQIEQKNNQIFDIQTKAKDSQRKLNKFIQQLSIKQKQQANKLQKLKQQVSFNQTKLIKLQTQISSKIFKNGSQNMTYNQLFVGQIVQQTDRYYIIGQIQKVMQRQIKRTKLLYTYPLMKSCNIHSSVDGVPHYIILIKMKQRNKQGRNFTIGLFSQKALQKNSQTNNKRGFICSVTNRQVFYLNKSPYNNPRVTQYNEFYVVFGNSQIRFKTNSPILQCKIGHNFRSFDTGNMKNGLLFTGSTQQQAQMEGYQIYQILF